MTTYFNNTMTIDAQQYLQPFLNDFFETQETISLLHGIDTVVTTSPSPENLQEVEYIIAELIFQKIPLPIRYYVYVPSLFRMNHYSMDDVFSVLMETPYSNIPSELLQFDYLYFYIKNGLFHQTAHQTILQAILLSTVNNGDRALSYALVLDEPIPHSILRGFQRASYNGYLDAATMLSSAYHSISYTYLSLSREQCEQFGTAILDICSHITYASPYYYFEQKVINNLKIQNLIAFIKEMYLDYPDLEFFTQLWRTDTRLSHDIAHALLLDNSEYVTFLALVCESEQDIDYYALYVQQKQSSITEISLLL